MSTYAIGDIQGCFASFRNLLKACAFNPSHDVLWLVGDLVNRGPNSLATLRYVRDLGPAAKVVLGNHDLYLLMVAYGALAKRGKDDTLSPLLEAPDADELLTWLRHQPLCYAEQGFCLVHAGLLPNWTVAEALALSAEVEAKLQGKNYPKFLSELWGSDPNRWQPKLRGIERLRMVVNVMTRMRFCTLDGALNFKAKGPVEKAPADLVPWFDLPDRQSLDHTLLVGHWSALGLRTTDNLLSIDTGCLWGGKLTAVRLEDRQIFQVDCSPEDRLVPTF
ncbi:MAG: hypothetical protein RIR18_865 [Pseudomonadota bacterium]|jgi:bis(5'-nucleosyl)-tetraphosphatase (symmetrical)